MAVPTREEIAESLWNVGGSFPFNQAKETDRQRFLELADGLTTLLSLTYAEGFGDGVAEAQAMTNFTDETVQSIFNKVGLPNTLG